MKSEASQTPKDDATTETVHTYSPYEGLKSEPRITEEERKEIEKCENWNKMLFMSKQSWPIEKNIKEFSRKGDDVYLDVYRVADIVLTMNKFILLSDPMNGSRYGKYIEEGGYFVINFTRLRVGIGRLLGIRNADITPDGILTKRLEEYMLKRGVFPKLDQPEIIKEYASLAGKDERLIRIVDLREINEVYYTDFCKHWKELMGDEGSIFLSVDKIIERFQKK